jgi:hypothetical protein
LNAAVSAFNYTPLRVHASPTLASRIYLLKFRMTEQLIIAHAHGAQFDLVTEGGAAPSVAEATLLLAAPNPMLPVTIEQLLYQLRQFHVVCYIQYGPQHTKTLAYAAFIVTMEELPH